jgi:hypothetical protein
MHRPASAGRLSLLTALAACVAAIGCLDGPFAHVNPHDAETPITLTIVGGADTLRVASEQVLYQVSTDPVTNGFTAAWTSSAPVRLTSLGLGRFQVGTLPNVPTTVQIRAQMGPKDATRDIVILPAP